MLKTSRSIEFKTQPSEGGVRVDGSSRVGHDRRRSRIDDSEVDGNEIGDNKVRKKVQKCKNLSKSKKVIGLDFLTPGARLAFIKLRQAFVKAPIFHHFDPEHYIRIVTNRSGYTIGGVFSQLTSNNLGQLHLVAFFSQKIILAETRYKTHNVEFLAIVEAFKTWRHYLE